MQKVKFLTTLILSLFLVSTFLSCDKENDNGEDNVVSASTISAKWEISNKNSPYASFEFNEDGNYIVVENVREANLRSVSASLKSSLLRKNASKRISMRSSESESNLSPIHFGTYKIEGENIILSGFGLIEVVSITSDEFSFSFTLESTGKKDSFVAAKSVEPISSSSRTEMFCRTWIGQKVTLDISNISQEDVNYYKEEYGENWKTQLEQEETDNFKGVIILFSRAGTYLVLYDGEAGEAGLSEWKWTNKEEVAIYYSWDNWEDNYSTSIVIINQLNNNTLVLQENDYGIGYLYHLALKN